MTINLKTNNAASFCAASSILIILGVLSLGVLFGGCATKTEDENSMPWSQPASWESNKMPIGAPNYSDRRDY